MTHNYICPTVDTISMKYTTRAKIGATAHLKQVGTRARNYLYYYKRVTGFMNMPWTDEEKEKYRYLYLDKEKMDMARLRGEISASGWLYRLDRSYSK